MNLSAIGLFSFASQEIDIGIGKLAKRSPATELYKKCRDLVIAPALGMEYL